MISIIFCILSNIRFECLKEISKEDVSFSPTKQMFYRQLFKKFMNTKYILLSESSVPQIHFQQANISKNRRSNFRVFTVRTTKAQTS